MRPFWRASSNAGSSTTPPRARLIKKLDGFIRTKISAPMLPRVFSVSGVSSTKKSNSPTTSRSSSRLYIASKPGARRRADADDTHAEGLAFRRQRLGDQADAENADRLVVQKLRRPALPLVRGLGAYGARQIAGQRQHAGKRRLGDRWAVDAAHIGDDDVFAQSRLVGEIVRAGAQRLNPFQPGAVLQHLAREHWSEGEQRIGLADMRTGLGVMVDHRDRKLGKACLQAIAVLVADGLGESEQNEQVGHWAATRRGQRGCVAAMAPMGCARLISFCRDGRQAVAGTVAKPSPSRRQAVALAAALG